MVEAALKKKKDLFTRKFDLKLRGRGGGTSKLLHWKRSFAWCWNLDTSESRSGILGNS